MGVGTFESDFNNTGSTLIISSPFVDGNDYERYLAEVLANEGLELVKDGDIYFVQHAGKGSRQPTKAGLDYRQAAAWVCESEDIGFETFEEYVKSASDDFHEDLSTTISEAAKSLNMDMTVSSKSDGFKFADFDGSFVELATTNLHGVGIRGWEGDYILGVAVRAHNDMQSMVSEPDAFADSIIAETGRAPRRFADEAVLQSTAIFEMIRISLQQAGVKCRYRTSGYTSKEYLPEADAQARIDALRTEVADRAKWLNTPFKEALADTEPVVRATMAKVLFDFRLENGVEAPIRLNIPYYNRDRGNIVCVNPLSKEVESEMALGGEPVWGSVLNAVEGLIDTEGLVAIPAGDNTKEFFQYLQLKEMRRQGGNRLFVSAGEYTSSTNEDVELQYHRTVASIASAFMTAVSYLQRPGWDAPKGRENKMSSAARALAADANELRLSIRHSDYSSLAPGLEIVRATFTKLADSGLSEKEMKEAINLIEAVLESDWPKVPEVAISSANTSRPRMG